MDINQLLAIVDHHGLVTALLTGAVGVAYAKLESPFRDLFGVALEYWRAGVRERNAAAQRHELEGQLAQIAIDKARSEPVQTDHQRVRRPRITGESG